MARFVDQGQARRRQRTVAGFFRYRTEADSLRLVSAAKAQSTISASSIRTSTSVCHQLRHFGKSHNTSVESDQVLGLSALSGPTRRMTPLVYVLLRIYNLRFDGNTTSRSLGPQACCLQRDQRRMGWKTKPFKDFPISDCFAALTRPDNGRNSSTAHR